MKKIIVSKSIIIYLCEKHMKEFKEKIEEMNTTIEKEKNEAIECDICRGFKFEENLLKNKAVE